MVYITGENKIMTGSSSEFVEVINDTDHLPLIVCDNVVLMTHGKLCTIQYDTIHRF